ncbi:MAG TPA: 23S rRNA (guanosine(2251)-2'-O)-methyltransferase RlmB [Flavobacteriaceae bacterium]|nr:23S rRNA (guanosine(2251)-2'-O)-methyltransferase RlmB [Flavobacteriaceae bacterium]
MSDTIFGIHSIEEALNSGQEIDKVFIQKGLDSTAISKIITRVHKANIPTSFVPIQKLNRMTSGNHQGVAAKISPIQTRPIEKIVEDAFAKTSDPLFILLDEVTDVRNFGAIIRTAECSGAQGVIVPKQGSAAINEQTVKTSAGAIFNIPICKTDHLKDALFFLQSYDVQIVSATEKTDTLLYEVDFKKPTALIMGSEGKGVSSALLKMSDVQAKLPLLGETPSLNVSVACGLFLYEAVRQKL